MSACVAMIGTVNRDRIITHGGAVREGLGGILYNVLSLAPYLSAKDLVLPIARLGAEDRERAVQLFRPYPWIDPSGLLADPAGTNETVLRYRTPDEREETLVEKIAPLGWEEIRPAAACDLVLVNLIWGKEITPALLRRLAGAGRARIVLDVQSLTLTFRAGPDRGYRNIPEWKEWAAPAHTVKGNEEEIRWLIGEGDSPFGGDIEEALHRLLDAGPRVAIATRGTRGFTIAWDGEGARRTASLPAIPVPPEECDDTTGCGDTFSSGYLLGMILGEKPLRAALLGSSLAALSCRTRGLRALARLGDPAALRAEAYRDFEG
ncbi:MAG: carbohydrate kinase family protein [Candidatus Eisenbacteria bacterium]|nr:carbohydrate kinase family protein [Candidatus Eisenbacteria bacterium]